MLKIFLNGETGKMGSCISSLINNDAGLELVNQDRLKNADVVIDYSHPDSTASILQECIRPVSYTHLTLPTKRIV